MDQPKVYHFTKTDNFEWAQLEDEEKAPEEGEQATEEGGQAEGANDEW